MRNLVKNYKLHKATHVLKDWEYSSNTRHLYDHQKSSRDGCQRCLRASIRNDYGATGFIIAKKILKSVFYLVYKIIAIQCPNLI